MVQGDRQFLGYIVMLMTAIAITSFAFGYADSINVFFATDNGMVTPDSANVYDEHEFLTQEELDQLTFFERSWRNLKYNLGRVWEGITGVAKQIPVVAQIYYGAEWVWSGFMFIISILMWNAFPSDMPVIIQIIIMTPIYTGILVIIIDAGFKVLQSLPST